MAATIASSREAVIARAQVIVQVAVLELAAESLAIGQAAAQARVIVRGVVRRAQLIVPELVPVLERGQVVAVLALVQAVAVLEPGPVAAVRVRGHPRAQLVVPLGTKSVTTAHRPDLVPLLVGEDLVAAVAETTREPVAAEAVIAWEVAG
jgi:hypothetical protein